MPSLNYLTVQDVLWINLQITRSLQNFDTLRLEEATFYQYGYGQSLDLVSQASRLVHGFLKLAPFANGNEATALVACDAFLRINGKKLGLDEKTAADWLRDASATKALPDSVQDLNEHHGSPDVQGAVEAALKSLGAAIGHIPAVNAAG